MMRWVYLFLFFAMGCQSTVTGLPRGAKTISLDNGSAGYSLECSLETAGWEACQKKADKICGDKGYETVSQKEEDVKVPTAGRTIYGGYIEKQKKRVMQIQCRK